MAFKRGFADTISCSHPCNRGLNKYGIQEYPLNCGYCYPCLIRKSSLLNVNTSNEKYWMKDISLEFFDKFSNSDIINDSTAVINSVYRYAHINDDEIRRLISCTGKLSVEEINKFVRVYKQTMNDLAELFSKDTGMSIKSYLTEKRMQRAAIMLQDPNRSVKNVAASCGFEDSLYFSRAFSKYFGISPQQYRSQILKDKKK